MDPSNNRLANSDAVFDMVTSLKDGRSRNRGSISGRRIKIFLFSKATKLALFSNQPRIHWIMIISKEGLKRPRRESDHSSSPLS